MLSFKTLPSPRIIAFSILVAGTLSFLSATVFAQACGGLGVLGAHSSSGTKFLLVFMPNDVAGYDADNPTRYQDIYLASNSSDLEDTVTITCRAFPKFRKVINLPPGGSATYRLSDDPAISYPSENAIVEVPEIIDSTVFKVVATSPITCYGMNNKRNTADAFLALPFSESTPKYIVMAYTNSNPIPGSLTAEPSEFAVASFTNSNTVTITPASVTSSGNAALAPMTFILDSDECVLIQGSPTTDILGDMTGSVVTSTGPIVVYGGNARTEAPTGISIDPVNPPSRDHVCEAMPPLSTWDTSFVARNFGRPSGDVMRVLASVDNTIVKINGKTWGAPLMANKFRDTLLANSAVALDNIAAVESSEPVLVGMIAHTSESSNASGDPFLAIVPPLQQTYNDFTYFITTDTLNTYDPKQQFLIIVTEVSGVGKITIDNSLIPPPLAYTNLPYLLNGKHYAIATIQQTPGIHRITNLNATPDRGFTILAYGWGNVISYGYTAGQLLVPKKGIIPLKSPTGSVAPTPGDSSHLPPSIIVQNILSEKIYFDSAKISYSQNPQNINVHLKKDISLETGTLVMAEEKTLELITSAPVKDVISGKVRIWYHSALWMNMMPVDFPFVITPQSQADVNGDTRQVVVLENYPNPAAGRTTVHFAIPARAYASVKIYDALGRVVRIVSQGTINSGDQQVQVSTRGLIPGDYTLELIVPELGISEHRKMIVIE